MTRLELALPLLAALAVACADDSTAMTTGTESSSATNTNPSTSDVTTDQPTSGGPTTVAPTTATPTATDTDVTTTSPGTTGPEPTTATTTTANPTQTDPTTETTGGPGVCGVDGESISAELVDVGVRPPCGPLEFTGTRISDAKGPVWQLDGCACGDSCLIPDPWTFSIQAPAAWLPQLPACPRIVVERMGDFGGCVFGAVSVWDLEAPGEPAVFHAGARLGPTQAAAGELSITAETVQTCECMACCDTSELWDLRFNFAGADLLLGEGDQGALAGHQAINFESHRVGICDAPDDVHWAIRKPAP